MILAWRIAGIAALALGFVGIFLPLLPTVPFVIRAAVCFAKGHPEWEAKLLGDPRFGPHIRAWREQRAISAKGKAAGTIAFAASAIVGLVALDHPWRWLPLAAGVIGGAWMLTRPTARL